MFTDTIRPSRSRARRRPSPHGRFRLEPLESRRLLSTIPFTATPSVGAVVGPYAVPQPPSNLYSPALIRKAYGFDQLKGDGSGQTIAIVDAYHDPNIAADLAAFSTAYNLPAAKLTQVDQNGGTSYPRPDAGWSQEIALDVEWAHAIAPGATVLLVEANSASDTDLLAAVKYASSQASVVSMSWGGSEFSGETAYDSSFSKAGVTFLASSGDNGGYGGPSWPSVSPNVVSVGGSTLSTTADGTFKTETAWSGSRNGSGGGVSRYEPLPGYQSAAFGAGYASGRVTPDVSYDASPGAARGAPYGGFAVYDSYGVTPGWYGVGGTSAGAPQWAALVALADQARAQGGLPALSSQDTLKNLLYGLAYTEYQGTPSAYFHDVTSGRNAYYSAGAGFDAVTGLGTPVASALVPYASGLAPTSSASAAPQAPPSGPTRPAPTTPPPAPSPSAVVIPVAATPGNILLLSGSPFTVVPLPSLQPLFTAPAAIASHAATEIATASPLLPVAQPLNTPTSLREILSETEDEPVRDGRDVQPQAEALPDRGDQPAPAPTPEPDPAPPAPPEAPPAPEIPAEPAAIPSKDDALAAYLEDLDLEPFASGPTPVESAADPAGPGATLNATATAGAALAVWAAWEYRSRRTDRTRRESFRPGP